MLNVSFDKQLAEIFFTEVKGERQKENFLDLKMMQQLEREARETTAN